MLYVVRHGQTGFNEVKRTMGKMDIPLNSKGIKQAEELSSLLEDVNLDFIISSPLIRAKETAIIINKNKNLEIVTDDRISERGLGLLEGRNYRADNDRLWDININTDDYNVETMQEFADRVYDFLDDITKKYNNKDLLLVTHGGVSALIDCYFDNSLDDGPISSRFLKNGEVSSYKIPTLKKNKKITYKLEK